MRWILFVALIIGLLYLGDHTHQYVSGLSLIEIGHTTDQIQEGWQFWNGKTDSAQFAPFYSKVDGWNIFVQLWPAAASLGLLCVLLLPMSIYLFGRLSSQELKAAKQKAAEAQKQAKERISTAEKRALKYARSEVQEQMDSAKQAEQQAQYRETKARDLESSLQQKIEAIRWQAQQAITAANQETAELQKQLAITEKRKKNAAATAERRRRKLKKKTTSSS
ncbi:TPA: hypothetical protein KD853_004733 [Vibrio parahaemolyticus]|jgi:hypothetical protein|uniref:hypothetical protein n=2 Tax=Vibrio parahaemolyticus TaxID=670 RepID=UPI0001BC7062|nr:hypothetical protein [Vibrio parahaemolyticus]TNY59810.1 hypothetical protein CGK66_08745 [Vibrio parahaemolyticus]HBC3931555.1 hypothetical protein [Vibrio parahaemolyticus]